MIDFRYNLGQTMRTHPSGHSEEIQYSGGILSTSFIVICFLVFSFKSLKLLRCKSSEFAR
jgi:hypothetical protein